MDPDIQNIASEIKKYFYDFKRQQIGKAYSPSERMRRPAIWAAAAELCVELKADPFAFVKAAFMFNNVPGGPYPTQITGRAADKWYRQYVQLNDAKGLTLLEVTEKEVKNVMSHALQVVASQSRRSWKDLLMDAYEVRQDIVPAYARIFMFPTDKDILNQWGKLATEELNSNPKLIECVQRLGYNTDFTNGY
jgi:hypothetical protein